MKFKIGRFTVYPLLDGYFRLDQGMMIRQAKPERDKIYGDDGDPFNRIRLAARCYLIVGNHTTLFDTGIGNLYDPMYDRKQLRGMKYRDFFAMQRDCMNARKEGGDLMENLSFAGFSPTDIDFVTQSHLHLDHMGWLVRTENFIRVPVFKKATHITHLSEWRFSREDHAVSLRSYHVRWLRELSEKVAMIKFTDDEYEIEPGLKLIRTGGHTHGHTALMIDSDGEKAFFPGDLIPTHKYLEYSGLAMSYDLYPRELIDKKVAFLNKAAKEGWSIFFDHDPEYVGGKVTENNGKYTFLEDVLLID
jgi:glyoxylase-like metal-dependent hydrolase (beta-lactamase superfamily II)